MKLSEFDYSLPKELIAQYPAERRSDSRLLILERSKEKISHRRFSDIIDYLSPADTLVLNNTRVVRARMLGRREKKTQNIGGGKQEIFLLQNLSEKTFRVLARPAGKLNLGTKIFFGEEGCFATVIAEEGMTKVVKFGGNGKSSNLWRKFGQVPLPPYIKRSPQTLDETRYQTVYAREEGAAAAPTAGLHFTREQLQSIREKGVNIVYLTLHINYGTFAQVKEEDIEKHKMHKEYFILPQKSAQVINATRKKGGKVFAVGTTSVRVLETLAGRNGSGDGLVKEEQGWTELFIYPPYKFKTADCLLTNFHFPKSTLLMLVSAFAGKELLFKAYQQAVAEKYRFFSYGDAMLIV